MKKPAACGFCGSLKAQPLLKGPIVNICRECCEFALKIFEADAENEKWKAEQAKIKETKKAQT